MTIKEARERAGVTQAELARRLGCSQQNVAKWEQKKRMPKIDSLKNITNALGVSLAELLDIEPGPRWIPVSERLPELCNRNDDYKYSYSDYIILCDSIGDVRIGNYALDDGEKEGYFSTTDCDEFVPDIEAWMPLPEPYKENDDGQT